MIKYIGYQLDCVVVPGEFTKEKQAVKLGKKDVDKVFKDFKNEDKLCEKWPLAFGKCDEKGNLLDESQKKMEQDEKDKQAASSKENQGSGKK